MTDFTTERNDSRRDDLSRHAFAARPPLFEVTKQVLVFFALPSAILLSVARALIWLSWQTGN
jgi:hypothetical protein